MSTNFATGAALQAAIDALPTSKKGTFVYFDAFFYGQNYMSGGKYQGTLTPIEHFVAIGAAQGNKPAAGFDPSYYKAKYADLVNTNLDAADLIYHFLKFGLDEGRAPTPALESFNATKYLADNPDVATFVNANLAQFNGSVSNGALAHYVKFGAGEGRVAPGTAVGGQTFTLTTGIDTTGTIVGSLGSVSTAGNDIFNATGDTVTGAGNTATLTALDTLDGGAGLDTLNLSVTSAAFNSTNLGASVSNIETINVQGTQTLTLNAAAFTGVLDLNVKKSVENVTLTAGATTNVSVAAAEKVTTVTGGKSVTVTQAMDVAADGIVINKAGAVTVTATDSKAAAGGIVIGATAADAATGAVVVTSTGAKIVGGTGAVSMDTINVTGGTTVTVTQSATADMGDVATAGTLTDVVTQGAVTVTGGNTTTSVTVIQGDQVTARAAAVAAGAKQTQTVTFKALVAGNTVTVNGLTFTAAVDLTAAEVAQAFSTLTSTDRQTPTGPTKNGFFTGQNGTLSFVTGAAVGDTVTYTKSANGVDVAAVAVATAQGSGISAPTAPVVALGTSGVSTVAGAVGRLGVANGLVTIDDNATKSITTITVDGYNANAVLGAGGTLTALNNLTLKNSGTGTATVTSASTGGLTLNLVDVDAAVTLPNTYTSLIVNTSDVASTGAITAAGATSVTINAGADLSGGTHTFTAATAITVTGEGYVDLTSAVTNAATLKSIDASANSGGVSISLGATNALKVTGGSGDDDLTLAAAAIATGNDIDLGAGDDTLVVAAGTTAASMVAAVKGGAGTDTVSMGYADAVAASGSAAFSLKAESFERLTINDAASDNDATANETFTVNLANLAYNYVTVNGTTATASDILALTGMAANGTVKFGTSDATGQYTVALATPTGNSDVLNYVLASTSGAGVAADGVVGTAKTAGTVTANLVETFNVASSAADADGATNVIIANGDSVKTITVSGNAGVNLTSTNTTTLKTVDASGLTAASTAGGLTFTAGSASMTVTGGAGNDAITIGAAADSGTFNGNGGTDTFTIAAGADLVTINGGAGADKYVFQGASSNKSNYVVVNSVTTADTFDLAAIGATSFKATKITLSVGATETTQAYLDQAMATLTAGQAGWFQLGGNTFVVADAGAESASAFSDGNDFVVLLTGLVDLSAASFNATISTLEIGVVA